MSYDDSAWAAIRHLQTQVQNLENNPNNVPQIFIEPEVPLRIGVTGSREGLTKEQWHTVRMILYGAKIGRSEAWVGCWDQKGAEEEIIGIATSLGYKTAGFPIVDKRWQADIVYDEKPQTTMFQWANHWIQTDKDGNREGPQTVINPDGTFEHIPPEAK